MTPTTIGENELPSQGEVFHTMQTLLEGIAQIAGNHGFERGDDLMVWLAKNLPRADRRKDGLGTVSVKPLEWEELETVPGKFVATTIVGCYERWGINWRLGKSIIQQEESAEAAADACQKDYNRIVQSAALAQPLEIVGQTFKPLDDDAIMEAIRECFPWQEQAEILSLLTYEKSPPMFPQATYDVPSYRAERFVRAIEARVRSCLTSIGVEAGWQTMDTAPKDGTRFVAVEGWPNGHVYARVYRWEGHPNYWNAERDGTCIRPEYQERYLWASLPDFSAPEASS